MVKVRDKVRVYKEDKVLEIIALFDTGSGKSYLSDSIAEKVGYEEYPEPIRVPLAVKGKEAEVIGYLHAYLEINGYRLPEKETIGVVKDLTVDAIIGLNIIEPYNIILEKDRIRFKEYPPKSFLFNAVLHNSFLLEVISKLIMVNICLWHLGSWKMGCG